MRLAVLVASVMVVIVAAVVGVAALRSDDGDGDVITSPAAEPTVPASVGTSASLPDEVITTNGPDSSSASAPTNTADPQPTSTITTTSTTSTVATVADLPSCQNEAGNYRLEYPANWYAELDDPGWRCGLFDTSPFVLVPNSELPPVAIVVYLALGSYEENQNIVTDPVDIMIDVFDVEVAGRPAVCAFLEAAGEGYFDAGTKRMSCLVDWGVDSILIDASAWPGEDSDRIVEVAQAMLETLEPIMPLPPPA